MALSRDPVWITYDMASLKATSTGFLIAMISDMWLTAISHPSRVQPGRLSCPGTEHRKICLIFEARLFYKTHQSTTRLQTGTLTARRWLEYRLFAANQHTGEQPAATT